MKKTLLAAGVALALLGGVGAASADAGIAISIGDGYHHNHWRHHDRDYYRHTGGHYWWHNRWYDYQPAGYFYVASPYPYEHTYWRTHWRNTGHCRDWNNDGFCDRRRY